MRRKDREVTNNIEILQIIEKAKVLLEFLETWEQIYNPNFKVVEFDHFKNYLIPACDYQEDIKWIPYAEEADLLNVALFGFTAKTWRDATLNLPGKVMLEIMQL